MNRRNSVVVGVLVTLAILGWLSQSVRADVGVAIYGAKGLDARRTDSGHVALIVTDLCAKGIDQLRECAPGEAQGVVITKYPSLASDYDGTIFVVPLSAHFSAVDDPESVPVLTSPHTLAACKYSIGTII